MARRTQGDGTVADLQRWSLLLAVALSAIVYGPSGGVDGIATAKATVLWLAALAALTAAGVAAVRQGTLQLVRHPAVIAAVAFGLAMLVRALAGANIGLGMVGLSGRANGALMYLACVVLFVVAAVRADQPFRVLAGRVVTVTGLLVALIAVDEAHLGIGPDWADRFAVAGTLGNSNFLGAWAAIAAAFALGLVGDRRQPRGWRITGAVATIALVYTIDLSQAFQGYPVLVAVALVLGLAWIADHLAPRRWWLVAGGTGGLALIGGALIAVGVRGIGPFGFLADQPGVELREVYWGAAVDIFRSAPLAGTGPATFGSGYRLVRDPEVAQGLSLTSVADSAHNVVLHLLAEVGLIVALLHLAVFALVAWSLVRALRRHTGQSRWWIAVLGAAWVGYVLQALVSIDIAALAVLGWVVGGAIVAADLRDEHLVVLGTPRRRRRKPTPATSAATAGVAVVAALAAWLALVPLRADAASVTPDLEVTGSEEAPMVSSTSTRLAGWDPEHHLRLTAGFMEAEDFELAEQTALDALEVWPASMNAVMNLARIAQGQGDLETALERYEHARQLDPHHPELAVEYARLALQADERDTAAGLLDEVLDLDPDHDDARELQEQL